MLRITSVESLDGYRLRVAFNDGIERDVDRTFLLRGTLGEPLRDLECFRQVRVDDEARTVVWTWRCWWNDWRSRAAAASSRLHVNNRSLPDI